MIVIDWKLLREQKSWLLDIVDASPSTTQVNNALGLVHLLDALQDRAVDVDGVSELEVFGPAYVEILEQQTK
jgi:hypothetical protein